MPPVELVKSDGEEDKSVRGKVYDVLHALVAEIA